MTEEKPASTAQMASLHSLLTTQLKAAISDRVVEYEEPDKDGNLVTKRKVIEGSVSAMAVAAKFLKDNSITAAPAEGNDLATLEDQIKAKRENRKITQADLNAAMQSIGSDLVQ